ncbi:MAG TPA: hypothetical protein VEA35_18765 [Ramlibacter sp.]|nr:hypothetical protein [Ramlibacter sp.]
MDTAGLTRTWITMAAAAALAGCAAVELGPLPPVSAPVQASSETAAPGLRYRCEQDLAIRVELASDSATVDAGPRGKEVLLRDAGGVTPQHTVFSNPRLRAEFGVGADGREAVLHWLQPQPRSVRCSRI